MSRRYVLTDDERREFLEWYNSPRTLEEYIRAKKLKASVRTLNDYARHAHKITHSISFCAVSADYSC